MSNPGAANGTRRSAGGRDSFSGTLERLSLTTAVNTALPSSPQVDRGSVSPGASLGVAPGSPSPAPRRTSSTLALERRASTILTRKASTSSLHSTGGPPSPRQPLSRRTSLAAADLPPVVPRSPLSGHAEEEISESATAASVAYNFFTDELRLHNLTDFSHVKNASKTVIVLQDACFGHRYSRPRTTKANLSTVVERPERIHASILGVAAAYVCLGQKHSGGAHHPQPFYDFESLTSIPFRIHKSTRAMPLSSTAVTQVHGTKWMDELKVMCDAAEGKLALNGKELVRPPAVGGADDRAVFHEGDLYLCGESLNAMEGALGAVCDGVDAVFSGTNSDGAKKAFVCIRPPGHHCSSSHPSGFCWVNNVHVGIAHAAQVHGLTHAAIVDIDLHHGDGSQAIAWEHNTRALKLPKNSGPAKRASIGYFSLHDINSYPCEMGDEEKVRNASVCVENAHGQTIWNVHLQAWKDSAEFWELYETKYQVLLDKTRDYLRLHTQRLRLSGSVKPKCAIFLSSGFDASEWEGAGMQRHKVNVPTDFYARFTSDIVRIAEDPSTGADGRVISVLEGGYSDRALCSGVWSHVSGLTKLTQDPKASEGLAAEMGRRIGNMTGSDEQSGLEYDPDWWTIQRIEELEAALNPTPPPPPPKKVRTSGAPTYASSTQSFNAKMVSPGGRRSASSASIAGSQQVSRAPTPPPPEVDWAAAAHGLRKALIPENRQTNSYKPEDLAPESRAKRERQSTIGVPHADSLDGKRMTLRDRKAREPTPLLEEPEPALSRADRRKTMAGFASLGSDAAAARGITHARRRSSIASTASFMTDVSLVSAPSEAPMPIPGPEPSRRGAPSRGGVAGIAVRKTRAPPAPKTAAPSSRITKKPTLVPAPIEPSANGVEVAPSESVSSDVPSGSLSDRATSTDKDSDLDSLANVMKKMTIKLNMPSREEHDARERKRLEEIKPSIAAVKKPAAVRPRAVAPKGEKPLQKTASNGSISKDEAKSSPPEQKAIVPSDEGRSPEDMKFIPYDVEHAPPPVQIEQKTLVWLPPNTGTPPAALKQLMPTFTSTLPIPFGKKAGGMQSKIPPRATGESSMNVTDNCIKNEDEVMRGDD